MLCTIGTRRDVQPLPDQVDKVADVPDISVAMPTATGALVETTSGELIALEGGKQVRRLALGDRADRLVTSPDGSWLAAETTDGSVAIVDLKTLTLLRRLETAGSTGSPAAFDASGQLLLRPNRGAVTIWDPATGDELIDSLDLLRDLMTAWFLPDGRIELTATSPGLLDIPRDARPAAEIVRQIACRVPLRATSGRIEPTTPVCR